MVNTFQDIIGKFLNSLRLVALWLEIRSEFEVHFRITTENKDLMKPQRHRGTEKNKKQDFFLPFASLHLFLIFFSSSVSLCLCGCFTSLSLSLLSRMRHTWCRHHFQTVGFHFSSFLPFQGQWLFLFDLPNPETF